MCGIVAILSKREEVRQKLLDGIKVLQNRGYDSCGGIMLSNSNQRWIWKAASTATENAISKLEREINNIADVTVTFNCGCFQTRWATHGAKTTSNAHPHQDETGRFFVVHNGIISNYASLKQRLIEKGYTFTSQTDTEVIPHLLLDCQRIDPALSTLSIWKKVISVLEGTWALIMCDVKHPQSLFVAKHGSPLLMAYSADDEFVTFASELSGIHTRAKQYVDLEDGAVFEIDTTKFEMVGNCHNGQKQLIPFETSSLTQLDPKPYKFWTEKEINEQPERLWDALNCGGRLFVNQVGEWQVKLGGLDKLSKQLLECNHLILTGCGTSYHAGLFSSFIFKQTSRFDTVHAIDASEFVLHDIPTRGKTVIIIISQSGETKDCERVIQMTKDKCTTIGVVNGVGSWIARNTHCGVYLNAGREFGVASTKSFTSQCLVLNLIAQWFSPSNTWCTRVFNFPERLKHVMNNLELQAHEVVLAVQDHPCAFLLGRGISHAIALEGALKLKELTYKFVEGYPSGALKHGPFAVISSGTPVIIHVWSGEHYDQLLSACEQVTSRGAKLLIMHNNEQHERLHTQFPAACIILVKLENEWEAALASVIIYQYAAVQLSIKMGNNPDFPRNLAKVVTVDG